jgi:antitoxin (DNA-binding transcriptional repressor) of toxin-antitoxin stability system
VKHSFFYLMKTVSIREMKAHWSEIEDQVREGASFLVLNRGKPAARIVPPTPREVLVWDDHVATAVTPAGGQSAEATVRADREGRW